ncbi:MAG: homoserine O-acetyltransferase/O-succinyltransferase [Solirubrobacteraceae bacterium]|nr:homoserine O-acetyltransferase/O-succinyltransferase [Solirubrobacteraceae bacterium]
MLESGATLAPVDVAYATYGELDADAGNAVLICHALTGDANAAVWWHTLVGPGRPVDTDRFFVVCANLLGGCQGTTGPSSVDPATGEPYGLRFPLLTVRDLNAVHRALLHRLGVRRLYAAVGGSLGGMQALQWALDAPEEIERAAVICASARLSAQNIGFSKVARAALLGDPQFADGAPNGMAVARMMAHITYLSEEGMRRKFDRARRAPGPMTLSSDFEVEHYLDHQAEIFLARFDALTYLYLSRTMDYFEPFAEPPGPAPTTRILLVSFDSDWRFGSEHSRHIAQELRARGAEPEHVEIASPWGHDSFLMDVPAYHEAVARLLA